MTLHKEQLRRGPPEPPDPLPRPGRAPHLAVGGEGQNALGFGNRYSTDRGRRSNIERILRVEDGNGRSKTRARADGTEGHDLGLWSDGAPWSPKCPRHLTTSPRPSATSVSSRGSASVRSTRQCCLARGHAARRCARCRQRSPPCTDQSSWRKQFRSRDLPAVS